MTYSLNNVLCIYFFVRKLQNKFVEKIQCQEKIQFNWATGVLEYDCRWGGRRQLEEGKFIQQAEVAMQFIKIYRSLDCQDAPSPFCTM